MLDEINPKASSRTRIFNGDEQHQQRSRMLTEEDAPAGTETINVIWGVDRLQDPPARDYASGPHLESFEVDEPWMQRNIYAMCAGTSPDLVIVSRSCWILEFKTWLESNGRRFPVEAGGFYEAFDSWLAAADTKSYQQFWFEDGVMKGTFISFYVQAPTVDDRPALDEFVMRWQSYVWRRNIIARDQDRYSSVRLNPAEAWISSELFAEMVERDALEDALVWPSVAVVLFTIVGTLLLSCNCGMVCAVTITLVVASSFFALLDWLLIGNEITWREATCLVTFLPCFAVTLLRFVVAYTCSQAEIPALHPPRRARITSNSKKKRGKRGPTASPALLCSMPAKDGVQSNADVQKKRSPQLWLGRVMKERKARIAVVLAGEGKALLSFAFVAAVGGLSLVSGETSGFEGVGLGLLASSLGCLVFTLGLLPVLLLAGFGPTLTRRVALHHMKDYLRPPKQTADEDRSSEDESHSDPEEQKNRVQHAQLTAQVLGLPFTMMVPPVETHAANAAAGNTMGDSPRLDLTEINGARALQHDNAFMAIAFPNGNQLALPPLPLGAGDRSLETTTSPATGMSFAASTTEGSLAGSADQVIVEH